MMATEFAAGDLPPTHALELVNARLNAAGIAATTRFMAQLTGAEGCALELALAADRQRFLARAATQAELDAERRAGHWATARDED